MIEIFKQWTTYLAGGIEAAAAIIIAIAALQATVKAIVLLIPVPIRSMTKKKPFESLLAIG